MIIPIGFIMSSILALVLLVQSTMANKAECRLEKFEQMSLRAHLSATVIEATALERFKYFRPASQRQQAKTRSATPERQQPNQQPYSVLFQIKRIFKYEHRLPTSDDLRSPSPATSTLQNHTYFYLSAQDDASDDVNLNSFFLVENFIPPPSSQQQQQHHHNHTDCKTVGIQLNRNYYLFIDGQDTSVKLNDRRVFTYPIR